MADVKISSLADGASVLTDNSVFPVVTAGVTYKVKRSDILKLVTNSIKAQLINYMVGLESTGLWFFDKTGNVSAIPDSNMSGDRDLTLRDSALAAIYASTCSPGVGGLAPYLTLDASHLWTVDDKSVFSFVDAPPCPFTLVALVNIADVLDTTIMSKVETGAFEWSLGTTSDGKIAFHLYSADGASYAGIVGTSSIASLEGTWLSVMASYDGMSGLYVRLNGVVEPSGSDMGGTYTGMVNGTAKVKGASIGVTKPFKGKMAMACIIPAELSVAQITGITLLTEAYAGILI